MDKPSYDSAVFYALISELDALNAKPDENMNESGRAAEMKRISSALAHRLGVTLPAIDFNSNGAVSDSALS